MRIIPKTLFICLFFLIFSTSCKKEKVDADCGCDSATYLSIENLQARHIGNGTFVINKTDTNGSLTYGFACDVDGTWEVSTDEKIWNYTLSGNLKSRCQSTFESRNLSMIPGGPIQITFIQKND
jgi:hypothetical protein